VRVCVRACVCAWVFVRMVVKCMVLGAYVRVGV